RAQCRTGHSWLRNVLPLLDHHLDIEVALFIGLDWTRPPGRPSSECAVPAAARYGERCDPRPTSPTAVQSPALPEGVPLSTVLPDPSNPGRATACQSAD